MSVFKKGDRLRLKVVVPEGTVEKMRMDDDGIVQYQLVWVDDEGAEQHRWFDEAQLAKAD